MSDPLPVLPSFPHYEPPPNLRGIPIADQSQANYLMKAIKAVGKFSSRRPRRSGRKGLQADQNVRIKRKKPKFY